MGVNFVETKNAYKKLQRTYKMIQCFIAQFWSHWPPVELTYFISTHVFYRAVKNCCWISSSVRCKIKIGTIKLSAGDFPDK